MRTKPSYGSDDTVIIWASCLLLALILGAAAAYAVSVAVNGAPDLAATVKEMLALVAAGFLLIVLALQKRLVRAFLISFAVIFFITLAFTTHGFAAL